MGIQLFSATLDTLAWVILLLLFELETAVIPDDRLQGGATLRHSWCAHALHTGDRHGISWVTFGEWQTLLPSEPLIGEACSRVSEGWSVHAQARRLCAANG